MASQVNFTQISSIDDIIVHIYKFLDFGDQLRLSCVNAQLKIIFKSYIWKEEYSSLLVHKGPTMFVVFNGKRGSRLCLTDEEYQKFLQTYAADVRKLKIHTDPCILNRTTHDVNLNLQDLLSLQYERSRISVYDVKVFEEGNTNLEELQLKSYDYINPTDELMECILLDMMNLKVLRIDHMSTITQSELQSILLKPQLKTLKLNAEIVWDNTEKALTVPIGINEFILCITFDRTVWPSGCFKSYIKNCKSLTGLTITEFGKVTDEILATIAETCNCLKKLRFETSNFSDVNLFAVSSSVMDFSLFNCEGLSFENLKQILSRYNITKFSSTVTKYKGEFEDFQISPFIESLHINANISTLQFESVYKGNTNLKDLTWYNDSYPMSCITPTFSLNFCINLHTLCLIKCQMSLAALLELKSLHRLEMPQPGRQLQWSFFTQLLQQHSSLRELLIWEYYGLDHDEMDLAVPHKAFATQVHTIQIPIDILLIALDFWIDLFCENKSLRLTSCIDDRYEILGHAVKDIVNHRNFPKSMKTIDVCGFRTDCKFVRNHYDDFIKKLQIQTENSRYMYGDYDFRCWNKYFTPITCYKSNALWISLYRK